ncbi:MAG: PAS domain-containing protein [Lactobacillus sp.]|jgi:DUF438 domain-containing protein|nr:PAS domain-containing protein [Lactobacillus sp.]MCI2034269.1 PAS domain-containing protein [Lactobacillus sp.]
MTTPKMTLDDQQILHTPSGEISLEALRILLNTLPFEVDYVDADDRFKWFSQNHPRIFARTPDQVGRKVLECHPGKSRDKVAHILEDFHAGTKDHVEFWLPIKDQLIYISYFALRNEDGDYLGCFEFTGDVNHIQSLQGMKNLANSRDLR